ncbi:MAG: membrane protein insertion efficiency factor YidD [Candidatus Levybacteria bacterium]|nr:membrane protein insertion efficiency factor YidD [Candidatus Levybacteria bacterium]
MRHITIVLLTLYQAIVSPLLKQLLGQSAMCRYPISCSEYAKQSIRTYGLIQGGTLAILRFLSCLPAGRPANR